VIILIPVYITFICALVYTSRLPWHSPFVILLLSLVSYLVYRQDKRAAMQGQWRTPERILHFLSLLGGWPGALIAQRKFRHKSSKSGFRIVFYITVFLNIAATGCYALPCGKLQSMTGLISSQSEFNGIFLRSCH
jgi:uncharacterized membrane protein YsdA (DUF1294 family)